MNFLRTYKKESTTLLIVVFVSFLMLPLLNSHQHKNFDKYHHCKTKIQKENYHVNEINSEIIFKEICFKCELNKLFFNQQLTQILISTYSLALKLFFKNCFFLTLPLIYYSVISLNLGRDPPKLTYS